MQWSSSYYYHVKTQGGDVVVCKQAFISIHGITAKRLRRLCEHAASGSSTPPTDKRGKHNGHYCIDSDLVKQVKNHNESFSAQESHYSRSDNHGKLFQLHIDKLYAEGNSTMSGTCQKLCVNLLRTDIQAQP